MPLDVPLTIHNQLWTLLEADAGVTAEFRAGNRSKATDRDFPLRDMWKGQAADYPQIRIRVTGDDLNTPPSQVPQTFGMNAATYTSVTCDHGVPGVCTAVVTIIHDNLSLTNQSPKEALVKKAIFSVGPRLGLNTWVNGFTMRGKRTEKKDKEAGGTLRTVTEFTLTINIRPRLSQLTS